MKPKIKKKNNFLREIKLVILDSQPLPMREKKDKNQNKIKKF